MNTPATQIEWEAFQARVKEAFGRLTDDDLAAAEGNADDIVRAIQQRYDYAPSQAEEAWDVFMSQVNPVDEGAAIRHEDADEPARERPLPYDPDRTVTTPEEAQAHALALQEARNARREF